MWSIALLFSVVLQVHLWGVKSFAIDNSECVSCSTCTENAVIKSDTLSIANEAFKYCEGLLSVTFNEELAFIGDEAFFGTPTLTTVNALPSGLASIGIFAFSLCTGLTSFPALPEAVTTIAESTFEGCTGLTTFPELPSSLESIGVSAFKGCSGLVAFPALPLSLTLIEESAFRDCSSLSTFPTVPASVKNIGFYCFVGTFLTSGINVQFLLGSGALSIGGILFTTDECGPMPTSVTLDLSDIGADALVECVAVIPVPTAVPTRVPTAVPTRVPTAVPTVLSAPADERPTRDIRTEKSRKITNTILRFEKARPHSGVGYPGSSSSSSSNRATTPITKQNRRNRGRERNKLLL